MTHVLGIDPGASGALVLVSGARAGDERIVTSWDMPVDLVRVGGKARNRVSARAVCAIVAAADKQECGQRNTSVCIEHVHGMGRDGAVGAFSFGRAFGIVETAAHACGLNVHLVTPQLWKGWFKLGTNKTASRTLAKQLFPASAHLFARIKDDGRAEAALIAYYWLQRQFNRPAVQW